MQYYFKYFIPLVCNMLIYRALQPVFLIATFQAPKKGMWTLTGICAILNLLLDYVYSKP